MYIIKNAVKNLKRNQGRNLLIAMIILTIMIASGISIIIHASSNAIINDYKNRFGSEVLLTVNDPNQSGRIEPELLLQFGMSELLQSQKYIAKVTYTSTSFTAIDKLNQENDPNDSDRIIPEGYLIGSSRIDINDEFRNGIKKIIAGSVFTNDQEVLISKKLAEANQLKIGDEITLVSTSLREPLPEVFTICGIYEDMSIGRKSNGLALSNTSNEIYGSFKTVTDTQLYKARGTLDAKFYLKDPEKLSAFQHELKTKGLPDYFMVSTDEASYHKMVEPVENLANLSNMFTFGILTIGSFILIVLSIFAIRERIYEIGVLRAMGMKKKQVVIGLLSESIIITSLCLIIGLSIAAQGGKILGKSLLEQQGEIAQQLGVEDHISDMQVGLTIESAGEIILVSILLGILSGAAGIICVTRYEPRKILTKGK